MTTGVNRSFRIRPRALVRGSMPTLDLAGGGCRRVQKALLVSSLPSLIGVHQGSIMAWISTERLPQPPTRRTFSRRLKESEEIREEGRKSPFSLSLSLSSRSQGHTCYEGMKRKERSLKAVISRLEEGTEMGEPLILPHHYEAEEPNLITLIYEQCTEFQGLNFLYG